MILKRLVVKCERRESKRKKINKTKIKQITQQFQGYRFWQVTVLINGGKWGSTSHNSYSIIKPVPEWLSMLRVREPLNTVLLKTASGIT